MEDQDFQTEDEFRKLVQKEQDSEKNRTFRVATTDPEYTQNRSGSSKLLLIILGLVVLVLIGGIVYLFRDRFAPSEDSEPSPTPTLQAPVADETPEPTPQPLDRSQFKIRVLNGTKTSGLAASVSENLKELGYEIERTGNATNSAFTKTQVRVKNEATSLLEQLIRDLSGDYSATKSSDLKDTDAADAEIILGTD